MLGTICLHTGATQAMVQIDLKEAGGEMPAEMPSKLVHCVCLSRITLTSHMYRIINPKDYHQKSINQ